MTVSELGDEVLDRRVREAMQRIAADYQAADAQRSSGGRSRWGRRGAPAVAATVALGVATVWLVTERSSTEPAETRSVTTAPPRFGDSFTVPDVEPMPWAVELDPTIDVGDFERPSRLQTWLHSNDAKTRWLVSVEDGRAAATIIVAELPAWTWKRYEAGALYRDVEGLEARLDSSGSVDQVAWLDGDVVRTAEAMGSASDELADIVRDAAALDDLADFEVPAGFEEVNYRPFTGWQFSQSGWSIGVIQPVQGQADLHLAALVTQPDTEAIAAGWLLREDDELSDGQRWSAWVHHDDFIVWILAPGYVDDAVMREIASLIDVVPATIPERPLEVWTGVTVETHHPVAGGELSWGRWLAVIDADAEEGRDVHCLAFTGAVDVRGCSEPGSVELSLCRRLISTPSRAVMITTETLATESLPVSAEVGVEIVGASVEQSGGLTFAIADVEGTARPVRFVDANGTELCRS
jgi:hypothetical protein